MVQAGLKMVLVDQVVPVVILRPVTLTVEEAPF